MTRRSLFSPARHAALARRTIDLPPPLRRQGSLDASAPKRPARAVHRTRRTHTR